MAYTVTIDDALGMDASVRELQWTTERPKVSGWYWVKFRDKAPGITYVARVDVFMERTITMIGIDGYGPEFFSCWLGPLPEPPAPK